MMKEMLSTRFRTTQAGSHVRVALVAVMLVLALPVVGFGAMLARAQSGAATATADACPPATPTSGTPTPNLCVEIGQYDIYFTPNLVTIPADTPVRVVLVNHGATTNDFTIADHKNPGLQRINIPIVKE